MTDLETFRSDVHTFLAEAKSEDVACPAFGAIMPPAMFEPARAWQRHCFKHDFAGLHWPREYGGQGLTGDHNRIWFEECARAAVAPYMNFQGIVLAGAAIIKYGTDEQKERYLRATLAADIVWCQLFSEPGSGSDLVSLGTRAEPNGSGWTINGQKVWSSTAQLAQHGILLARTNPEEPRHRGISFFLFAMDQPGVEVRPIKQMTGDEEFCEVFFTDAQVAQDQLLGDEHGGWGVATSVLADERSEVGASALMLERQLADLRNLASNADGSIAGRAVHADRVLDLTVRGKALGSMMARATGQPTLGPLTKLGRTEQATSWTDESMALLGAHGMLTGPIVDEFLYAPGMRVAGGTSEIQRNLVGERLLGLPREQ